MKVFEVADVATAHWESELRSLRVEWHSFMDPAGFREVMVRGIAECKTRGALAWIADTRSTRGVLTPESQQFLVDYIPVTRASGLRAILTVRPQATLAALSNKRWQRNVVDPQWSIAEVGSLEEAADYCRQVQRALALP